MSVSRLCLAALAAVTLIGSSASAMENRMSPNGRKTLESYTGSIPPCGFPKVFNRISWHFYEREKQYWDSPLQIAGFQRPEEIAFSPWGREYVPRRFCKADVWTSDGKRRDMFYSIAEGQGEAGIGWGVQWCIEGLDRNLAYAPLCKMAAP
jgi:hypothetical protein